MDDERKISETEFTFEQVKEQLIQHGKKNSSLTYKDVMDRLAPFVHDPEQIEQFIEQLSELEIDVNNESDEELSLGPDDQEDDELKFEDELTLPPGVKTNDPVRLYLKEIGRVQLLSAKDEVELAKRIEQGDEEAKTGRSEFASCGQYSKSRFRLKRRSAKKTTPIWATLSRIMRPWHRRTPPLTSY